MSDPYAFGHRGSSFRWWATFLPSTAPCMSAVRKWIPLQTRASTISLSACEKRSKPLGGHGAGEHLLLTAVNVILSVAKKALSACRVAPLMQVCPAGWSGKPGVTSGGPETGTLGLNSG